MHRPSLVLLVALAVVTVSQVSAEYIWTGTEWKWQDPDSSDSVGLNDIQTPEDSGTEILDSGSEGSGDGDTWDDEEDYDDDYDYDQDYRNTKQNNKKEKKEKKKKDKKDRQKNRDSQFYPSNSNSAILPASDDEDLFESSGDSDGFVSPGNHNEYNFNNNNNNYQYNTESPTSNNNNNNNQNEYFDEDDEYDYDENYDYDDYKEDYNIPIQNNINNNVVDPTNAINNIYNPNPTPSTTVRSFTTKRTPTTTSTRPEAGSEQDENTRIRVNRPASFFAQPGILAAVIGGAVVGLLCAILLVMFIVYRMRKKDEGSYALDEPKRSHNVNSYSKPPNREFYA